MDETSLEARAGSLESGAGSQAILELVPAQWWVELDRGLSGGQGHVQKQLFTQEVL